MTAPREGPPLRAEGRTGRVPCFLWSTNTLAEGTAISEKSHNIVCAPQARSVRSGHPCALHPDAAGHRHVAHQPETQQIRPQARRDRAPVVQPRGPRGRMRDRG